KAVTRAPPVSGHGTIDADARQTQTVSHTYAAALKSGLIANAAVVARIVRTEEKARESKANNVIISGLTVSDEQNASDQTNEILCELQIPITPGTIKKVALIGKESHKKVCVTLSADRRAELLKKCRALRNSVRFREVYVNPDLT